MIRYYYTDLPRPWDGDGLFVHVAVMSCPLTVNTVRTFDVLLLLLLLSAF